MKRSSWVVPYLALLLLLGTGYLAILPPFEGFDEFAHYSSLRQIAHTGTIPVLGASYLDDALVRYLGPMPYGTGTPPFDPLLGAKSYPEFFERSSELGKYVSTYREKAFPSRFEASRIPNWQAQHPPLYYLTLAPVLWAMDRASFMSQLFVLRFLSYLLAICGVLFGLVATGKSERLRVPAALGFVWYPLLSPQFFPEFARIGNDSLGLLLLGWLMYLVGDRADAAERRWKPWLIGAVLGLGLLTKALFLPIMPAVVLWTAIRGLEGGAGAPGRRKAAVRDAMTIAIAAVAVGGWWYVGNVLTFGEITGGDEAIRLAQAGGLFKGLTQRFSFFAMARGLITIPVTWAWIGTWSVARVPAYLQLPFVVLVFWTVSEFLVQLRRRPLRDINWLTLFMTLGICGGLVHRILQGIAIGANGEQGGWYLHILMPWTALALGVGVSAILRRPLARALLLFLTAYAVVFHAIVLWSEVALFSGCATKGTDKLFHFSTPAYCLDRLPLVVDRLGILGWPGIAVWSFSGALVSGLWLCAVIRRDYAAAGAGNSRPLLE
jgi:hypothetical protein